MRYDVTSVFQEYLCEKELSSERLEELIRRANNFMNWVKPHYILIGGPSVPGLITYEKNYQLDFGGQVENSLVFMNAIYEEQIEALQQIDSLTLKYAMTNPMEPHEYLFKLQFNVELVPGNVRTIERKIVVLEVDEKGAPDIAIVGLSDITHINSERKIVFDVRTTSDTNGKASWVKELREKINKVLYPTDVSLTKRELEILKEIERGNSSQEIAENLFISKATVDTHRQNMIKKFNVPNTVSLVHLARQMSII